jgi:shikimate dehydrogenase
MRRYGLVGKQLTHSFSKSFFEEKFSRLGLTDCSYENFPLHDIGEFHALIKKVSPSGLNVTIPYKESVIEHVDELEDTAREIGAVNCIKCSAGKLHGYNTDSYGFAQSIKPFLDHHHERALILGTGGSAKAVMYALQKTGVEVFFVTSSSKKSSNTFFYNELNEAVMRAFKLIVNCTPVGMFPNINESPQIPYQYMGSEHLAYDLVYNPTETLFLSKAAKYGAVTMNGLSMLQLQAEKSWEIWNT